MAARNALPFLAEGVQSILDQTLPDWELLIGDDCSTDGTTDFIAKLPTDPRIRCFRNIPALGLIGNKNMLIQQARGEFVTQQDADDRCALDRLERQVALFDADPDCGIVGCGLTLIDRDGQRIGQRVPASDLLIEPGTQSPYAFWFAPMMVRRSIFDQVGLLNSWFDGSFGEDFYWALLASEQVKVRVIADPIYDYRQHRGSVTASAAKPRNLVMSRILEMLAAQRRETGSDDLAEGRFEALVALERDFANDRRHIGEMLRVHAARAIDHRDLANSRSLLTRSLRIHPFNLSAWRTVAYYIRRRWDS